MTQGKVVNPLEGELGADPPPLHKRTKRPPGDGMARAITWTLLILSGAMLMLPFFILLSNSLKLDQEISNTGQLFPGIADNWDLIRHPIESLRQLAPQWKNYPAALEQMGFWPALSNTVVITVCCVIGQVISSSLVGYGFARYRFRGRDTTFAVMLATMMLPAQVTMIPVFLIFRQLGWIDTFLPLIVPNLFGAPFFIFMFRQFFQQVPEELLEAARLDGASALSIYWRLMLPLSKPVIAIVAIYTFMFTWNDFMAPLIYLNSPENRTLALALNSFNGQYGVQSRNLLMAASFVTMLPCILLFFAAQRFFIDTGASSGLKG